jgi:hypothetical protein
MLTCAHVDKHLRKLQQPVGLVRLNRGPTEQFGTLNMEEVDCYAAGKEPWTAGGEDLAFIRLTPQETSQGAAFSSTPRGTSQSPSLTRVNSVFGLVEEFIGVTTRQDSRATTLVRGVLTSGVLRDIDALSATLKR